MKKIPTFDDLVFLPGTLTRFVIEGYRENVKQKLLLVQDVKIQLN